MLEKEVVFLDFSNIDLDIFIPELDARRSALNMSYQNVADACGVSQTTIIRIFKRQTEPTLAMLQKIATAVRLEPKREEIILAGYTQEDYIRYLQKSLEATKEEHAVRMAQQEAHYNMLLAEKNRWIKYLFTAVILVAGFLVAWLIIDVTHPTVGWIQREVAYNEADGLRAIVMGVKDLWNP